MFIKVNTDLTLSYPYTFCDLRTDNQQISFASDLMANLTPENLSTLAAFNVFLIVENPPAITAEQRLIVGDVLFVDPDYVRQYTIEDLTADEIDDRESRGSDWVKVSRRLLRNTNSPYRQMQTWSLEAGKGRYANYIHDLLLALSIKKVRQVRFTLIDIKSGLGADSFTGPQLAEIDRLLGFLNVTWVWADL